MLAKACSFEAGGDDWLLVEHADVLVVVAEWADSRRLVQRSKMSGDGDSVTGVISSDGDVAGEAPSLELADRCVCDISGMLLLLSSKDRSLMLRLVCGLLIGVLPLSDKYASGIGLFCCRDCDVPAVRVE